MTSTPTPPPPYSGEQLSHSAEDFSGVHLHKKPAENPKGQSDFAHTAVLVSVDATGELTHAETYRASCNVRPVRKESHGRDWKLGLCSSCILRVLAGLGIGCVHTNSIPSGF